MDTETMESLRAMAVDDHTRSLARDGATMTHAESDDLGEEVLSWITTRLGCRVEETGDDVTIHPAR